MTPEDEALHAGMTRKPLKDTRTDKQKVTYLLRKHEMTEELLKHAMGKIDSMQKQLDGLVRAFSAFKRDRQGGE